MDNNNDTTRRKLLGKVGAISGLSLVGIPSLGAGTAVATSGETPAENYAVNASTGDPSGDEQVISQGTNLGWYSAAWHPGRNAWLHDIVLTSTQVSTVYGGDYVKDDIGSTSYSLDIIASNESSADWKILPSVNSSYAGVGPKQTTNVIPDWFETPFDLAIGILHPAAAVAVTLDDIYDVTRVNNQLTETTADTGWEMNHSAALLDGWERAHHNQRFLVEVPPEYKPREWHLRVISECADKSPLKPGTWVKYRLGFHDEKLRYQDSDNSNSSSSLSTTDSDSIGTTSDSGKGRDTVNMHPEKMSNALA